VLRRIAQGGYAVDPGQSLWHLLRVMARNKIRKFAEHHGAAKRDVAKEVRPGGVEDSDTAIWPAQDVSRPPSPAEATVLADELQRIRSRLRPDDFEIFRLQFEGFSNPEIAEKLGCARQTVRYKARRIEQLIRHWAEEGP